MNDPLDYRKIAYELMEALEAACEIQNVIEDVVDDETWAEMPTDHWNLITNTLMTYRPILTKPEVKEG